MPEDYKGPERRGTACTDCNKGKWDMATKIITGQAVIVLIVSAVFAVGAYASNESDAMIKSRVTALETHIQYQNDKLDELIILARERNNLQRKAKTDGE